jgi:hypothetical protein
MVPPKYRVASAIAITVLSVAPIAYSVTRTGQSQTNKLAATSQRQERQRLVANQVNVDNCYQVPQVVKGTTMSLLGQSQSDCVKDANGTHFGYISIVNGEPTVIETFVIKEINVSLSQIKKENQPKDQPK